MYRLAVWIPMAMFAMACVPPTTPPRPAEITVMRARFENLVGRRVRWGGQVASVNPTERETCFEITDRPLASDGEPLSTEQTDGRFLACTPHFYARGVYEGQDVTIAGTLEGPVTGKLDKWSYRYPRVAIQEIYFWPREQYSLRREYGPRSLQPWGQGSRGYWW